MEKQKLSNDRFNWKFLYFRAFFFPNRRYGKEHLESTSARQLNLQLRRFGQPRFLTVEGLTCHLAINTQSELSSKSWMMRTY
eukprot:4548315-Amphidinium_carterae.1